MRTVKIAVLSNAGAAGARRYVPALRQALPESAERGSSSGACAAGGAEVRHHVTHRAADAAAVVGHDRWHPDDVLVINGGDGTVQHALSVLLARCPPYRLPQIACLPGGTTNMTARDLNRHRRFRDCLAALRHTALGNGSPVTPRPLVRVGPADTSSASRCGLFFGIGTIVDGIEYFQTRVRYNGGAHELGAGIALFRAVWGIARGEPPFDRPLTVGIEAGTPFSGGEFRPAGAVDARLLLATTLDRLILGSRPYWGPGAGALKCTLVECRAPGFVARFPRLLRGRPDHRMTAADGYHSAHLDTLRLTFAGSYTLDGELFTNAGDTMTVSATEPVRFLQL